MCPCQKFKYDVFVSYSSENSNVALDLALNLRDAGIEVWLYEDHIPSSGTIQNINDGIMKSRNALVLLSNNYLQSPFCKEEFDCLILMNLNAHEGGCIVDQCRYKIILQIENILTNLKSKIPQFARNLKTFFFNPLSNHKNSKDFINLIKWLKKQLL
jgi:hypothetical protein